MIEAKYHTNDGEVKVGFLDIEELMASPLYDRFIFIDMSKCGLEKAPVVWPIGLQILKCEQNRLERLENLPVSLRMLYARANKIEEFPSVVQCKNLELIDLCDNNIRMIDKKIPESVRAIDISFNKLRVIHYHRVPDHVKITASFCFLTELPPFPFKKTMIYDHNDIVVTKIVVTKYVGRATTKHNHRHDIKTTNVSVYNDPQNVHASSVQQSANKSLDYVLKYESRNQKTLLPHLMLSDIHMAYKRYQRKRNWWMYIIPWFSMPSLPLDKWCKDPTIHSDHGVSYKTLLRQVWAIIQDHSEREELEMILCEELNASRNVCFTGRFTRTLNALSGFVEEVRVGISSREQMQNQISKAIDTCRKKYGNDYVQHAQEMVGKILADFNVSENQREAWLNAIE